MLPLTNFALPLDLLLGFAYEPNPLVFPGPELSVIDPETYLFPSRLG